MSPAAVVGCALCLAAGLAWKGGLFRPERLHVTRQLTAFAVLLLTGAAVVLWMLEAPERPLMLLVAAPWSLAVSWAISEVWR